MNIPSVPPEELHMVLRHIEQPSRTHAAPPLRSVAEGREAAELTLRRLVGLEVIRVRAGHDLGVTKCFRGDQLAAF